MRLNPDGDGEAPGELPAFITPTEDFYVYSNRPRPPEEPDASLLVEAGDARAQLRPDELRALATTEVTRTLQCIGQGKPGETAFPWRWGGISNARWGVVPVRRLLGRLGVRPTGRALIAEGRDGWKRWVPKERVERDDRVAVALTMNGEPLDHDHGAPCRLLVPGDYGEMHVKWLRSFRWGEPEGDQVDDLSVKPTAFATGPAWGTRHQGPVEFVGAAYAGEHPVTAVELRLGQRVVKAELLDEAQPCVWRRWRASLQLQQGWHAVSIGAVDASGRRSQPWPWGQRWGKSGQAANHDLVLEGV
jgi:sulfane dehydrogenase subunit SoxC